MDPEVEEINVPAKLKITKDCVMICGGVNIQGPVRITNQREADLYFGTLEKNDEDGSTWYGPVPMRN
jgi:hypothetical protein